MCWRLRGGECSDDPGPPRKEVEGMKHVAASYIIAVTLFHPLARHSSRLGQPLQVALGAAVALAPISLSPGSAQAYGCTPRVEQNV
jgi:hypothetical protein